MRKRLERLNRLARAQHELGRALEAKLSLKEKGIAALSNRRLELHRLANLAATENPVIIPQLLRSIAEIDSGLSRLHREIEKLQHDLVSARTREKIVSVRESSLFEATERKFTEELLLDVAMVMAGKASRKNGMVD